tara:strand:- start:1515 stop:2039 length:525 start_codon:yes stop_codon:yes gene_type:complete
MTIKRAFDVVVSLLLLVLLFPFLLLFTVLILVTSGFPIMYNHKRVGKNEKLFVLYKFRTMKKNNITLVGKWMRKLNFDELPQLLNVFEGTMSLVGPRPEIVEECDAFTKKIPLWKKRVLVSPGITGLAQIHRKSSSTPLEKIKYDLRYLQHQSFLLDMKILFRTIFLFFENFFR